MTIEGLRKLKIDAMKQKNALMKNEISAVMGMVNNAAIAGKCVDNIPESMVDDILKKEKKTLKEMIDTCPIGREDLKDEYLDRLYIIESLLPPIIEDIEEIKGIIENLGIDLDNKHRGDIMKALKSRGDIDMGAANKALKELI